MLLDISGVPNDRLDADLCIAGGGAAGLTLAAALAGKGLQILVLEAGGLTETPASADSYRGDVDGGAHHPAPHLYRHRALGGSSRRWGGGCVLLDPIDFEARDWVPGPGWPYGRDVLLPFYRQATEAAEAGAFDYDAASPLIAGVDGEDFHTVLERFSRPTDFGVRWRKVLESAPEIRVLLNATATDIALTPDQGAVDHLQVRAPDGRRIEVHARRFVLAMGGLEIPRLLLASNRQQPAGVGNVHGWVGRNYMCHMAAVAGSATFTADAAVAFGHRKDSDGVYYRRRLALTAQAQRERKILNLAFRLQTQDPSDPSHGDGPLSALHLYKRGFEEEHAQVYRQTARREGDLGPHLANIARHPFRVAGAAATLLRERFLEDRKAPAVALSAANRRYAVEFHGEQAPNPDSRVTLSDDRDALGLPRLKITWRPHPLDTETVIAAYRLLAANLERSGAGRLDGTEDEIKDQIAVAGAYGGHHIGAARMSLRPEDGVVDPDARVHGLRNLYIASAAVMPTSGQANPTLTILALTYKLAAHLNATPA